MAKIPMAGLTLVLPGLRLETPEPPIPPNPFPKLGALLAKAEVRAETKTLEARLFRLFGHAPASCEFPPVAAATALVDRPGVQGLVRCDPVHVRADPTRLLLFDAAHFELDAADADALIALLAKELPSLGLHRGKDPKRWYANAAAAGGWHAWSPREMAGRALSRDLPLEGDARAMHRLLTEAQMVLHETPINQARVRRALPPINGVWLWGGGALSAATSPLRAAFGNDVLLAGLAQAAGIEWRPTIDPAGALAAVKRGEVIVVAGAPFGAPNEAKPIADIESTWCPALSRALWRGTLDRLTVLGEAASFTLTRVALLRFWRKAVLLRGDESLGTPPRAG